MCSTGGAPGPVGETHRVGIPSGLQIGFLMESSKRFAGPSSFSLMPSKSPGCCPPFLSLPPRWAAPLSILDRDRKIWVASHTVEKPHVLSQAQSPFRRNHWQEGFCWHWPGATLGRVTGEMKLFPSPSSVCPTSDFSLLQQCAGPSWSSFPDSLKGTLI